MFPFNQISKFYGIKKAKMMISSGKAKKVRKKLKFNRGAVDTI